MVDSKLGKAINGCYTRIIRIAINTSWKIKLIMYYKDLPKLNDNISERRMSRFIRFDDDIVNKNWLCWLLRGKRNRCMGVHILLSGKTADWM